jgi:hypothetical protein
MRDETTSAHSTEGRPAGPAWAPLAVLLVLWILGLAAYAFFARVEQVSGLLFVLLGASAACLASFTTAELRRAPRTSPSVYGLLVGALCVVRALRLREAGGAAPAAPPARGWENGLGCLLYVVLLGWTIGQPYLGASTPRFMPWDWVFYWPSILVVLGGALTLLGVAGGALRGRIAAASVALAGTIGALAGLVVALVGFMVTACFIALVVMTLAANPAEDRRAKRGEPGVPSPWSRAAWLLFPLITVLVLVITLVMVMTPMTRKL